jgi:hypothetical protein
MRLAVLVLVLTSPVLAETVEGRVVDGQGHPVVGVTVFVLQGPGAIREGTSEGPAGRFVITDVVAGTHDGWAESSHWFAETQPVVVPGRLDVRVQRGLTVRGDVLDEHGEVLVGEVMAFDQQNVAAAWASTDPWGGFVMHGLQAGAYDFKARRWTKRFVPTGRVTVFPGNERERHLRVSFGLTISGVMVDQRGERLYGTVQAIVPGGPGSSTVQTDENGAFTFEHLKPGKYKLRGSGPFDVEVPDFEPPVVTVPADRVRLVVNQYRRVTGRLLSGAGQYDGPVFLNGTQTATRDGRFTFVLESDHSFLRTRARLPFRLAVEGFAPRIWSFLDDDADVDLGDVTLERGRSVTVKASDAEGRPVPKARLSLRPGVNLRPTDSFNEPNEVVTNADGIAVFQHLPAEQTALFVLAPPLAPVVPRISEEQTEVAVTLHTPGTVRGVLRDAEWGKAIFGTVFATCKCADYRRQVGVHDRGHYEFTDLGPGQWTLVGFDIGRPASAPVTVDIAPGVEHHVGLTKGGVALTAVFDPPLESKAQVELLPGQPASGTSKARVLTLVAEAVSLNPSDEGWKTAQASPGPATVLVLTGDVLRVGALTVPRAGGRVKVKLSALVHLKP